ncbi:MAG: ATP phosphoribosyltransferase regulatory subunit [Dethiobacter sp.]|nr:ATP phosphoribosyltransferase regulatory subunit [Dethiobacter sp.]MBS3897215.1 ATP phosphoribosyltransferase regulatory subunit [Dethiobacter sp.]MBS3982461.1 ATP phosphoribosyltransferase regulatory subunit [Dethiobacter sp.]MCL4462543.1 ATP phosphoribosyltransferase regulatory subunit [Bacillota bacterium]MCL5993171.1 ATP phosphoribosyltransferase regulatory subunit [Bacillota bacterium]
MNEKLRRLLTPEGVRDLLPELAGQKRELEKRIQASFSRWGYGEVSTPAFEYSANFVDEMKAELTDKLYRFLDERGRTLVLRPDFTLPLARVVATHLAASPLPLRLCYGGDIYRYAHGQQGKQRVVTQAGVELIGSGCAGADAEVIALAVDVLLELGLAEFTFCLGHAGFLERMLTAYGVAAAERETIKFYFNNKDFVALKMLVQSLALSEKAKEAILRVPGLRGGKEILAEAAGLVPGGAADEPLRLLAEVWEVLADYGATKFITLDLGLVRMLDYYTGMVFEGYTGGLGYALCGGGRYDQLLGHFGPQRPAVGFAINVDHVLKVLQRGRELPAGSALAFVGYGKAQRAAAFAKAALLRQAGERVLVDVEERPQEAALAEGERLGAAKVVYLDGRAGNG